MLVGGVFTRLVPIGQPAYRLNLLSATCSTATAVLVFLTVIRLSWRFEHLSVIVRYFAAAAAALALATSRTLWPQSVIAEVYGLELLFAAAIAYVLAARPGGKYSLWPPAFIAGLAMTHHTTILFSIAAGAIAVIDQYRRRLLDIRLISVATALFLLPLSLYLLLPLRAAQHPASNWGDPSTFGRFVDVVSGAPYHYLIDRNPAHAVRAFPAIVRLAFGQFAWWIIPLAVAGIAALWERDRPYAAYLSAVIVLAAAFLSAYHAEGREVYMLQAYLALCIAGGVGMMVIARWLQQACSPRMAARIPWVAGAAAAVTVIPWTVAGFADFNLRHDWATWEHARDTLAAAPRDGTLLTDSDEATFPLWYAQRAVHLRQDVQIVDTRFRDPVHQR